MEKKRGRRRVSSGTAFGNIDLQRFSPGRAADDVVGEDVVAASHGEPDAVLVVLEGVVGHIGVERLQHRQSSVAVVVDVVT